MWYCVPIEFSLIVFIEFAEFGDKNVCHYSKRAQTCHTATSCVRDHSATTVPVRHMWEAGSLNYAQFMLQWFAEFSEFLFHLGKTPISASSWAEKSERMKPAWNTFHKKHFQFVQNGTDSQIQNWNVDFFLPCTMYATVTVLSFYYIY